MEWLGVEEVKYPDYWEPFIEDETYKEVVLKPDTEEYKNVVQSFMWNDT